MEIGRKREMGEEEFERVRRKVEARILEAIGGVDYRADLWEFDGLNTSRKKVKIRHWELSTLKFRAQPKWRVEMRPSGSPYFLGHRYRLMEPNLCATSRIHVAI